MEEAQARAIEPADLIIQLGLETNFDQLFLQPVFPITPEDTVAVMKHPRTVMTFSDSGAHVSQIMDSSIHTHLLAYWVRDQGSFTLPEAIRMMTLVPARVWGFYDRGLIQEGFVADLNVFDPEMVGPSMPRVVYDLPSGGVRLEQRAVGFLATIVGGQITIHRGESTATRSGRLLRYSQGRA
jgi:N-acyl-D-amino-acid deacylase